MDEVAYAMSAIGLGLLVAAAASFAAKRSERRKWRAARKRLPYILD